MVNILGAGVAYPDVELSDGFLGELGLTPSGSDRLLLERFGVKTRRISLPLDYIESTRNENAVEGRKFALTTPTVLGTQAARCAMARAGIRPEQLGLIVADTATPYQTCPSEAQRIGGALGLKVPAYDFVGGAETFPLFIETIRNWKPERVPEFVLCVSTNTPSQHVNYSNDALAAYLFGDSASAVVISTRVGGKLKVLDSYLRRHGSKRTVFTLDRHVSCARDQILPSEEVSQGMIQGIQRLSENHALALKEALVIGPQLFAGDSAACTNTLGISPEQTPSPTKSHGYALGSSTGAALAESWDLLKSSQQVVILQAGDGMQSGSVMMASE